MNEPKSDSYKEALRKIDELDNLERRTGRSTRLIDKYIQELFEKKIVIVYDHYPKIEAHNDLFNRVMTRLKNEHHAGYKFSIKSDKKLLKIEII